jgi:imidazolonepropionase-like amidohydrolase
LYSNYSSAQIAVKGEKIYTMSGDVIVNGVILISDGKIVKVGSSDEIQIPDGYEIVEGKIVTPGLIDAHSVVGMSGIYNQKHDQDQLEKSDAIQPELRAVDAYNKDEALVDYLLSLGITTVHTGHGPGALSSGQTMIVKTYSESYTDYVIDSIAMVAFTLGSSVPANYQKPGTRSKGVSMLRQAFFKAKEYQEKLNDKDEKNNPESDIKLEILADVLSGKVRALFTVNRAVDIMAAIRLADEFGFTPVLDGLAESYNVIDELKKRNMKMILHPTMIRTYGDTKNASFETAAILKREGLKFSLQSGYEGYVPKTRVVLFEAAIAHGYGLPFDDALASITINAAEILGIENRVGSIEAGKDADLVIFDGNPFEYTSHVCKVIVNGKLVKKDCL